MSLKALQKQWLERADSYFRDADKLDKMVDEADNAWAYREIATQIRLCAKELSVLVEKRAK